MKSRLTSHLLTEYCYLKIDAARHTFGETACPRVHLPTEPRDVWPGELAFNLSCCRIAVPVLNKPQAKSYFLCSVNRS